MDKMKVITGILVLTSLLLATMPASAGLAGWQYQREIAIQENSGETLRDYQVLVELDGSDFPGEAQADGDDIRFTDADGRELSYWIEEFDAGSKRAAIWVKVPLIPANGEAKVTMWYGNPGAASASDGEAVFEFFDDFGDRTIDINKWDVVGGEWIEDRGVLVANEWASEILSKETFGDFYIQTRYKTAADDNDPVLVGRAQPNTYDIDSYGYYLWAGEIGSEVASLIKLHPKDERIYIAHFPESRGYGDKNRWYVIKGMFFKNSVKMWWSGAGMSISAIDDEWNQGLIGLHGDYENGGAVEFDYIFLCKYSSSEPTVTLASPAPATHTALTITKSPTPHSIRQFGETVITISIENSGTTDATDIEITDAIHPSFDLTSGDFPNPKRYDLIRPGETRDLQYTLTAKESGTFALDPATVTYADDDGNIQEAKSEPASIKVIPSAEGGTSHSNPSVSTASVQLHGEKTSVVLGEDILLKLSAVNLITKPTMHVQVIIIPPSGMSVTSSAFAKSGAGQYTTTYELEPGSGKDIEVAIRSNQVGDFDVNGRIIYYFGDDRDDSEDHTLTLPITVRAEAEQGASTSESEGSSAPGFAAVVAVIGLLLAYWRKRA